MNQATLSQHPCTVCMGAEVAQVSAYPYIAKSYVFCCVEVISYHFSRAFRFMCASCVQGYMDVATFSDFVSTTGGTVYQYTPFSPVMDHDQVRASLSVSVSCLGFCLCQRHQQQNQPTARKYFFGFQGSPRGISRQQPIHQPASNNALYMG